jgi:hypothetical protein
MGEMGSWFPISHKRNLGHPLIGATGSEHSC